MDLKDKEFSKKNVGCAFKVCSPLGKKLGIGKSIYDAEELPSCFDEFSTFVRGCAENSPTGRA